MQTPDPRELLAGLRSGTISPVEAARTLAAREGLSSSLDRAARELSPGDRARLDAVMPAISWELTKILAKGRYPDVPYDSPEHRVIIASATRLKESPRDPGDPP